MLGSFYDVFGKQEERTHEIPAEVLEIANKRLPDNFAYQRDKDGNYRALPKPDKVCEGIDMQPEFDLEKDPDLRARLAQIPRDKWDQYLYRSQRAIPIKSMQIGNAEKMVPFEMLVSGPYERGEVKISDIMMYPLAFVEPIKMVFESPEGDRVEISMQQQPYDNLMEIKFASVDFPALSVVIYEYSPLVDHSDDIAKTSAEARVCASYSVHATKGESARDTLAALRVFRGLHNGTTKVDGKAIERTNDLMEFDLGKIDDAVDFWEKALRLEEILGVQFKPGADFPQEDVEFFTQLVTCLLEKKPIHWEHPFNHFHVHGYQPVEAGKTFEDFIGKENIHYEFMEGPNAATLLGAEFDIFSNTKMEGFIISDVDWDDDNKQAGEIYITDGPDGPWILSRLYITKQEAVAQERPLKSQKGK